MNSSSYIDCLAAYGVSGAHPGGLGLTKRLLEEETVTKGKVVLDAGCGTGQTAALLHETYGADVVAVDMHPVMIRKARERLAGTSVEMIQSKLEDLTFADESFDLVLSESVLAFAATDQTLGNLLRMMKSDGKLLAIEMVKEQQLTVQEETELSEFYGLPQLRTREEWEETFIRAGFQKVEMLKSGMSGEAVAEEDHPYELLLFEEFTVEVQESMEKHFELVQKYGEQLGFCIFRCLK